MDRDLVLPTALTSQGISLRQEEEDDLPFLRRLYLSVRWEELAASPWTDEEKTEFLLSQFGYQRRHYQIHYADAALFIIEKNNQPVGRIYLHRGRQDIRVVDLSLLPEARGLGWGGHILHAAQDEAAVNGKILSIHVELFNPARRLYQRLGFQAIGENGPYLLMEWGHDTTKQQARQSNG